MGKSVYEIVTERILEKLEAGTIPWRKPWSAGGAPRNLVSGKEYRGANIFLLGGQGFTSPYWVSFKQAKQLGGTVRRGERSTPCIFWKWIEKPETGDTEAKQIPILRYYGVFNIQQCEGISHKRLDESEAERVPFNPIEAAEAIVAGYPEPPSIAEDGGASAHYRPRIDSISMPARETFDSEAHFYATLFHEMTHSTGHKSRLARSGVVNSIRYGSHLYSQEELVAEMGAAFLLAEAGIDSEALVDNSASYIASWLKALRNDSKLVVLAAAQAQKATDRILGRAFEQEEEATLAQAA